MRLTEDGKHKEEEDSHEHNIAESGDSAEDGVYDEPATWYPSALTADRRAKGLERGETMVHLMLSRRLMMRSGLSPLKARKAFTADTPDW